MDKEKLDVEDLIRELRHCISTDTCNSCPWIKIDCMKDMQEKAADALEQYHRSAKFHKFIWDTLGIQTMRQLIEMYHEGDEEDS